MPKRTLALTAKENLRKIRETYPLDCVGRETVLGLEVEEGTEGVREKGYLSSAKIEPAAVTARMATGRYSCLRNTFI